MLTACAKAMTFGKGNWYRITVSMLLGTVLCASCATDPVQRLTKEGRELTQQTSVTASPEDKLQTADKLLRHAEQYKQWVIPTESNKRYVEIARAQRQEREAAAILMRSAADDFVKRQEIDKARAVYRRVLETFKNEDYEPIRRSATSALRYLETNQPLSQEK